MYLKFHKAYNTTLCFGKEIKGFHFDVKDNSGF